MSAGPSAGLAQPSRLLTEPIVRVALAEDIGRAGDITSEAILEPQQQASAAIVARQAGRVAGLGIARLVFELVDAGVAFEVLSRDGDDVGAGERLALVHGSARALLTAERTALNFAGRLSGIATATRRLVEAVAGTHARIADTRKTTPGLRVLEKYAVRAGGGINHRFGLDDAVLIKDNHIAAAGSLRAAVTRARARVGHMVEIEVEVDTQAQLHEALDCGVRIILLDNMPPGQLREAVRHNAGRAVLEASGSVTAENVAEIARTGVDVISSGWITHSAPCLDVALDLL